MRALLERPGDSRVRSDRRAEGRGTGRADQGPIGAPGARRYVGHVTRCHPIDHARVTAPL